MRWNVTKSVITGVGHRYSQDSISQDLADDFVCVVMADGAGVARCAKEGANFTTKVVLEIIKQHKDGIFSYKSEEVRSVILENLLNRLEKMAKKEKNQLEDYMCTLMFFVSNGEKYIIGNLGDGLIGCMDTEGNGRTLSLPEQGKFANQSYFITQEKAEAHLRIGKGRYNTNLVYFLMTDGSAKCLYRFRDETFANALTVFCNWTIKYPSHDVDNNLKTSMIKLFPRMTNDDCALAMVYLREK